MDLVIGHTMSPRTGPAAEQARMISRLVIGSCDGGPASTQQVLAEIQSWQRTSSFYFSKAVGNALYPVLHQWGAKIEDQTQAIIQQAQIGCYLREVNVGKLGYGLHFYNDALV